MPEKASNKERVQELSKQLTDGLQEYIKSGEYTAVLDTMAKFHTYSPRNCVLIAMQRPDASQVCGYKAWQKLNRQVRKGEKGIHILAPMTVHRKADKDMQESTDEQAGKKDDTYTIFRPVTVFDISQTDGEDLPEIHPQDLTNSVQNFDAFMSAIESVSPVPMRYDVIEGTAKGYYDATSKEIVLRAGMSDAQTLKTAVHELTHARLHDRNKTGRVVSPETRETEAESTAYIVCRYFGLDTSDYSFPYVMAWSKSDNIDSVLDSMSAIQSAAESIITDMTEHLSEELNLSPVGIDNVKDAIRDMYGAGKEPDFSDLHHIDLLFSNGDEKLQYTADLIENKINVYDVSDYARYKIYGGEPAEKYGKLTETYQYEDAKDLIENGLPIAKMSIDTGHQELGSIKDTPIKDGNERKVGDTLYAPAYDRGWSVRKIPIKDIKWWGKEPTYAGIVYDSQRTLYATEDAAWDYIKNAPGSGIAQQVSFDENREPYFVIDHEDCFANQRDKLIASDAERHPQKQAQTKVQAKQKEHKNSNISL